MATKRGRPRLPTPGSPFYLASMLLVLGIGLIVVATRDVKAAVVPS